MVHSFFGLIEKISSQIQGLVQEQDKDSRYQSQFMVIQFTQRLIFKAMELLKNKQEFQSENQKCLSLLQYLNVLEILLKNKVYAVVSMKDYCQEESMESLVVQLLKEGRLKVCLQLQKHLPSHTCLIQSSYAHQLIQLGCLSQAQQVLSALYQGREQSQQEFLQKTINTLYSLSFELDHSQLQHSIHFLRFQKRYFSCSQSSRMQEIYLQNRGVLRSAFQQGIKNS